jgi:replicative DNA helicase
MADDNYVSDQIMQSGTTNFASQEAEESVLYSMLTKGDDLSSALNDISEGDFYFAEYGKVFRAIKATAAKGLAVDLVTVDATISELFPDESRTISNAMVACLHGGTSWRNIDSYIRVVKELSARRQSIRSVEEIISQLRDPMQDLGAVLDKLRTESRNIEVSKHKIVSMLDIMMATYEYLEKRAKGEEKSITTGIPNVDALIGGFFGGELTVIGARPSVGKSAFGANIAIEAAKKGFKVAVVSREMTDIQFGQRMISHDTFIDGMKLRKVDLSADDWCSIAEVLMPLSNLPISFMFTVRTVEDLRRECQKMVDKNELDMLIVDYLQLMHTTKNIKEEHLRVGYISKSLKDMATDFNIPIIALAQVNRDTDGQMPTLKSLKASGDIEQDADGVIFLHRPSSANDPYVDPRDKEYFASYENSDLTYICIGVAKQRQGAVGKACVLFDSPHMRYYPIDRGAEGGSQ